MNFKDAIFDLDGTLLDSMGVWDGVGEAYLSSRLLIPVVDIKNELKAMSLFQAAVYFKKEYGITEDEAEIIEDINKIVGDKYRYEVSLKEGVFDFLNFLKAKGAKMCIATAMERNLTEVALKRLGIMDFFCGIITCSELKSGKDSPLIYYKALEVLGASKSEALIFEDALHAIETASNSGFRVIGVYDESSQNDMEKIKKMTERYIYSFKEWGENL